MLYFMIHGKDPIIEKGLILDSFFNSNSNFRE